MNALSKTKAGSTETVVRRILRTFDRATTADLEAGARWYDTAADVAAGIALANTSWTRQEAAAVIAHLSPRTSWSRNVAAAVAMATDGPEAARALGAIGDNVDRAIVAVSDGWDDPVGSFGPTAHKTRSFYLNICGDRDAVTVDVWAARVAGVTERELKLTGVYDAVAHAYRLAARRRGVDPSTMQAATWIVARGGRSE